MSRREARGLSFARVQNSIRNFSSPFARGNGRFANEVDVSTSLIHSVQADFLEANRSESPVVEGISRTWRLREEILCASSDGIDITPFEAEDADLIGICAEPVKRGLHKHARMSAGWFELSPKEQRRFASFMRIGPKGEEGGGSHNFGRKPRVSSRETIRNMRQLPSEERMIAGEILRSDGEERRNRRRARACKRPLAEVLEFPARTSQSADESAAA